MASSFTPNLNLELQGTGDNPGTWGSVLNLAALTIVDNAMGGVQTLSLSNVNVLLTTTQSQNNAIKLTGTLTGNVDVTFPAIGRTYFVANNTTGNFTVTLKCAGGGSSAVIPQGRNGFIILDGVNVIAESAQQASPVAAVMAFAMSTVPNGWLECDGAAVSRTTYAALFSAIGTTYGAGDGVTTFNLPDLRAYFVRGWDHGRGVDTGRAIGSSQTSQNLAHTHAFAGDALPPHSHSYSIYNQTNGASGAGQGSFSTTGFPSTSADSAGTPTGTIDSSGGADARPLNVAMMYCIKI